MSDNTPPSQMLRVPSALVDAVKELSRLHRAGYTSAVVTGLKQLIANIDSTADSVASVAGGKSDTELLAELIAGLDERIATQVAVQVAQLEQRIEQLQQRQSLPSSPPWAIGGLLDSTPESQAEQSEPLVAAAPVGGEDVDIADDRNTLEDIPAPAPSNEPAKEAAPSLGSLAPLSSVELAKRLKVDASTVTRANTQPAGVSRL